MIKFMMNTKSCPDLCNNTSMNFRKVVENLANCSYSNFPQLINQDKNSEMTKINCGKEKLNCSSIAGKNASQSSSVMEAHLQMCTVKNCDSCKLIYSQKQEHANIYFEEGPNSTLIFKKPLNACNAVKPQVENRAQEDESYEICEMMFTVEEDSNDFISFHDGSDSSPLAENATMEQQARERTNCRVSPALENSREPLDSSINFGETVRSDDLKGMVNSQSQKNKCYEIGETAFTHGSKEHVKLCDSSSLDSSADSNETVRRTDFKCEVSDYSQEDDRDDASDDHPQLFPSKLIHSSSNSDELNTQPEENASSQACNVIISHNKGPKEHVELSDSKSLNLAAKCEENLQDNDLKGEIITRSEENVCREVSETPHNHVGDSKLHGTESVHQSSNSDGMVRGNDFRPERSYQSNENEAGEMACSHEVDSKKCNTAAAIQSPKISNETVQSCDFKDKISILSNENSSFQIAHSEDKNSDEHLHKSETAHLSSASNESGQSSGFRDNISDLFKGNAGFGMGEIAYIKKEIIEEDFEPRHAETFHLPAAAKDMVGSYDFKDKTSSLSEGNASFEMTCIKTESSKQHHDAASFHLCSTAKDTVGSYDFKDKTSNLSERNASFEMPYIKTESSEEHRDAESFHFPSTSNVAVGCSNLENKVSSQSRGSASFGVAFIKTENSEEQIEFSTSRETVRCSDFEDRLSNQSIDVHEMCEVIFKEGEDVGKPSSILFTGALPSSLYGERKRVYNGINPTSSSRITPRCGTCGMMFALDKDLKSHFCAHFGKRSDSSDRSEFIPQKSILVDQVGGERKSQRRALSGVNPHSIIHSKSQAKQTSYVCFFCHEPFPEFKDLKQHVGVHTGTVTYTCTFCLKEFRLMSELKLHERTHTVERGYSCYYCESKFSRHRELKEHLLVHTGKKAFVCKYCNKEYLFLSHLKIHMNAHVKNRPMSCQYCKKVFDTRKDFREHMKFHKSKPYACDYCDKTFGEVINLKTHMRIHTGRVIYSCMYCKKDFGYISQLKIHERTHTREKKYSCQLCGESFVRHNDLKEHFLGHTGKKAFSCNYCNKEFSFMSQFSKHLSTHTASKDFSGNRVERVFPSPDSSSKQVGGEERSFSCDLCEKVFPCLSQLQGHARTHAGEKSFSCDHCQNSYSDRCGLIEHVRVHTGELPFACDYCGKAFGVKDQLERHLQSHSGDPMFLVNFLQKCSENIVSLEEA